MTLDRFHTPLNALFLCDLIIYVNVVIVSGSSSIEVAVGGGGGEATE
jgi:hypothetical protein